MASDPQNREKYRNPELFLSELLKKSAQGKFHERDENVTVFYRATVVAVDTLGGQLENDEGSGTVTHVVDGEKVEVKAVVGPKNPRNSIKARIISDGLDQFISDESLRVFWPLFPEHSSVPVKPGEHVYVMFEDTNFEHGLWITKVPGQENLNFFRGQKAFKEQGKKPLSNLFGESRNDDTNLNTDSAAGESQVRDGRLSGLFK